MIIKARGTVTLPRFLRSIGSVLEWAREVNKALQQLRDRCWDVPTGGGGGGSSASGCPFGEILVVGADTTIRGGLLVCGDKNFNVANRVLSLASDGAWLVEISLSNITLGTDDDGEIFVGGVTTSSGTPAWNLIAYTGTENYTDTTNPSSPASPTGTAVTGTGILTITAGVASFQPTGCGTIRIGACDGILASSRG